MDEKEIEKMIELSESKERGLTVDEYRKFQARIDHELGECHTQAHLHGENEPTPHAYVAHELFWAGFYAGREVGINLMIDGLEIREEWDRIAKENEEKEYRAEMENIERRVVEAAKKRKEDKPKDG